jgi:two-component system, chemotaxis family, sensor kinase CheA
MVGQDPEMLQMFLEEAREHITGLEPDLLRLEGEMASPDKELINSIFRAVHSLKGSAGFFGFEKITQLSHAMENLLALVREGKLAPTSQMVSVLLSSTDKLSLMIQDIDNSDSINIAKELENLAILQSGEAGAKIQLTLDGQDPLPDKIAREFQVEVSLLKEAISHGHFLYAVRAFTKKDMKDKGKAPLDYLREVQKLGSLIGSYSDISEIKGFDDVRNQDIAFVFLFSSVLEPDLIALGLEVPEEQIQELRIPEFERHAKHDARAELLPIGNRLPQEPASVGIMPPAPPQASTPEPTPIPTPPPSPAPISEPQSAPAPEPVYEPELQPMPEPIFEQEPQSAEDDAAIRAAAGAAKESTAQKETLRVGVTLLNDLMTLAGELVLARNQLLRMASEVAKSVPGLQSVLQDVDMTTTMLQGKIMDTRMQPVSLVFNKFPRLIRDLQSKLGKKIQLEILGGDVDLDKSIIESLSDPLTHLVRNSADHAIELPDERKKFGKPETGTIWLKAYHEGGKVNIDVIDDGRGIDIDKVLKKAIERGMVSEAEGKRMGKKDVFAFLFAPGFSTAAKVSDVSGRGVGMDVVKTNIEKLGGSVSFDSKTGEGTTVNLKLPLTLAIIPSLIVTVQEHHFAAPQVSLKEIVRIKLDGASNDDNLGIEMVNEAPVLRLRRKLLPLVYLEQVLGMPPRPDKQEVVRILVLQHDENEFGLVVDEIFDSEEIVVKPIPRFFKHCQAYAGTTIMGDGSVSLILDVGGIATMSKLNFAGLKEQSKILIHEADRKTSDERQSLLLFENASDEYFALNLDLIKRIEKIPLANLDVVGDKEYIEHEGKSLQVLRMERFLPVRSADNQGDSIYVIIPKLIENPMGIVAHRIIDSLEVSSKIDTENIAAKGLIGSALINNHVVLFPDIYEIIEMADPEKAVKYRATSDHKKRVLLIEDAPFFRALESQYLDSAGFRVDTAVDGLDGLKKAAQNQYDLFVVDIIMPRLDGYEFVKQVRRDPNLKDIPAIALTTLSSEESRARAREAGFNAYEIKIHKDKLLETVHGLIHS